MNSQELIEWDIIQQEQLLQKLQSKEITPSEYFSKVEAHEREFKKKLMEVLKK